MKKPIREMNLIEMQKCAAISLARQPIYTYEEMLANVNLVKSRAMAKDKKERPKAN